MPDIADGDIDALLDELYLLGGSARRLIMDADRRAAIKSYADIQACPGSGKTTLVAVKLLLLGKKWMDANAGICVLTHTNVAKDEILKCLRFHPTGYKLLRYPHFIGTIQEFVNAFLALPYARSRGWTVNLFDTETYANFIVKHNWGRAKDLAKQRSYKFVSYFYSQKIKAADFALVHDQGRLTISPNFSASIAKHIDTTNDPRFTAVRLLQKREQFCSRGIFQYREMYALAEQALCENSALAEILRMRFPIVLVDEMQDAQKFQDELISRIFNAPESRYQKLGDPDQSIFDGIGGADPNESYNTAQLVAIAESHRLTPDIAQKIRGLSFRQIQNLRASNPARQGDPANTILLYDDGSIASVLEHFSALVMQLPAKDRVTVKAVGGVGKDPSERDLTIKNYWPGYEKGASQQSFKPQTLLDAVRFCGALETGNVASRVECLVQSILQLMRLAGKTATNREGVSVFHSRTTLERSLRVRSAEAAYREWLVGAVMDSTPSATQWPQIVSGLRKILELEDDLPAPAQAYLANGGPQTAEAETVNVRRRGNVYRSKNGIEIHCSTIHGVKGETHDATLVLETKFNKIFDISSLADCLIRDDVPRSSLKATKTEFMKRLYVATSRPRHLLCLAIHRDRLPADKRARLQNERGWNIVEL